MKEKSKSISGLQRGIGIPKSIKCFTDSEKHLIIQDYLESGITKSEIWEKYTGQTEEHGQILRWMRKFGYETPDKKRRRYFVEKTTHMTKKNINKKSSPESSEFEIELLKKRVADLEKSLNEAEMKAIAYSTMVDIAEKEFKIPIRKKLNTKP